MPIVTKPVPAPTVTQLRRFNKKVERVSPNGCWNWIGGKDDWGYGSFSLQPAGLFKAHRVAFRIHTGKSPVELVAHHCDNPACCNPSHLFEANQLQNVQDRDNKGRRLPLVGELHGRHKVTELLVPIIRSRYAAGETQTALGKEYGVSQVQIGHIVRRMAWSHVE